MNLNNCLSVVIPVYYGKVFITNALDSIFKYNAPSLSSVVVVEDGTPITESVEEIVGRYPVKYVRLSENVGVFRARLHGASLVNEPYLTFLDQDDQWTEQFQSTMCSALDNDPSASFAVCNVRIHRDGGEFLLYDKRRPSLTLSDMKVANQIISPSQVVMRSSDFRSITLPDNIGHPGADDWMIWLSLLASGKKGKYVPSALLEYLDHPSGAHNDVPLMTKSEQWVVKKWFPELEFSSWDQRKFFGRVALDGLKADPRKWLARSLQDPVALLAALKFRLNHKKQGIV